MQPFEIQSNAPPTKNNHRNDEEEEEDDDDDHDADDLERDRRHLLVPPPSTGRDRSGTGRYDDDHHHVHHDDDDDEEVEFEDAIGLISRRSLGLREELADFHDHDDDDADDCCRHHCHGRHNRHRRRRICRSCRRFVKSVRDVLWNAENRWWLCTMLVVFVGLTLISPHRIREKGIIDGNTNNNIVTYDCPIMEPIQGETQVPGDVDVNKYKEQDESLKEMDATELLTFVETQGTDGWSRVYEQYRHDLFDWKVRHIIPDLIPTGDIDNGKCQTTTITNVKSVYESACGVGRNLLVTIDILNEYWRNLTGTNETTIYDDGMCPPPSIVVYGNDYVWNSAEAANTIFRALQMNYSTNSVKENGDQSKEHNYRRQFGKVSLGRICGGIDSRNLSMVPSDSFDVVLTGYISPLRDPLGYDDTANGSGTNARHVKTMYFSTCLMAGRYVDTNNNNNNNNNNNDTEDDIAGGDLQHAYEAVQRMQQLQEDWYGGWVSEMVRIAKPGAPIVVEHVVWPKCIDINDAGGVSQDFWMDAIDRYQWPINRNSIQFAPALPLGDRPKESERYHVAMRKN